MIRFSLAAAVLTAGFSLLVVPQAVADPPYKNCTQAHNDGRWNIPSNDSAYREELDRDGDGYACEPKPQ